jgi:hypothetical protein
MLPVQMKRQNLMTDTNSQEANVEAQIDGGEGNESAAETIAIAKADYDKLNQSLGSLKRELKDLKKSQPTSETPTKETKTDDSALLQKLEKLSLRQAGIDHPDDMDLARKTAKKWGVDIDDVLADDDFKVKLGRQQDSRANAIATSDVKGGGGTSGSKNSPEYWLAKGTTPPADMKLGFKDRAKIMRAFMAKENGSSSGNFYNT